MSKTSSNNIELASNCFFVQDSKKEEKPKKEEKGKKGMHRTSGVARMYNFPGHCTCTLQCAHSALARAGACSPGFFF